MLEENQIPSININDLQNVIKIIDYACEQGAFKGWQIIEQVAGVRARIAAFVAHSAPDEQKKQEEPAPPVSSEKKKEEKKSKSRPVKKVTKVV